MSNHGLRKTCFYHTKLISFVCALSMEESDEVTKPNFPIEKRFLVRNGFSSTVKEYRIIYRSHWISGDDRFNV